MIQDIVLEEREPSVRTSNGTVNLKDISFRNEAVGLLYHNASTLGSTKAAQVYIKNYPGNIMVNAYENMAQSIMKDGELGLDIDKVLKRRAGAVYWIGEAGVKEFHALGQEKAKESNRQLGTVKRKGKGQLNDKRRGKAEEPLLKVLEQIAEHTGLDIEVSDKEVSEVRGYFEESLSRIVLNADANMFETVFHELGEFTDSWNTEGMRKFQTALLDWYFETHDNDKMQNLIESVQNIYKQQEGSKTYREAANEIVNDAISGLFATETGAKEFTEWLGKNRTETETKNILQTIADFLKDLCDAIRTYIAGHNLSGTTRSAMEMSEEHAQELRQQFLNAMDKAVENYQKAEKGKTGKGDVRHAIKYTKDNKAVAVIEQDIFNGRFAQLNKSERIKLAKNEIKKFRPGIPVSGRLVGVTKKTADHYTNSDYTDIIRKNQEDVYEDKLNASQNLDDVIYASTDYINEELNHPRKDDIKQFARGNVLLDIGGNQYKAKVIVGYKENGEMVFYDLQDLVSDSFEYKKRYNQNQSDKTESGKTTVSPINRIPQNQKNATKRFSLAVDSQGRELTKEQIEYFKDSKVRDTEGNLLEVYHGTNSDQFTVFDSTKSDKKVKLNVLGDGFYFAQNKDKASRYGQRVMDVYLNMKNPYRFNSRTGGILAQLEDDFGILSDNTKRSEIQGILRKNGFDGLLMYQSKYDEPSDFVTAVVFDSNQIKKVDNYNPTQNEDIRYSLNLSDYLGASEIDMFWEKIGERKRGTQFPKSRNGDSILTIGNKLVYTGRGYQNPKVNKIVEVIVKEDSEYETTYTSFVQEDIINDYEGNGIYKNTSFEEYTGSRADYYTNAIGRQVVIETFDGQDYQTNGKNGLAGKGQVRQRAYYNFENEQERSGDPGESGASSTLRYSLNDATDLSDFWFNNDNLEEPIGNAASILEEGAKLLQGKEVDTENIRRIARGMVKEYQSHYNVDTLSGNLEKLFSYMQTQDKVSYDDMVKIMTEITMPVIEESTSVDETQQEIYQNFKKKLRGMNIRLSQQQKDEVAHYYDSYENFRRKMFGILPLSDSGISLDELWLEISDMSQGFIDLDVTPVERCTIFSGSFKHYI